MARFVPALQAQVSRSSVSAFHGTEIRRVDLRTVCLAQPLTTHASVPPGLRNRSRTPRSRLLNHSFLSLAAAQDKN